MKHPAVPGSRALQWHFPFLPTFLITHIFTPWEEQGLWATSKYTTSQRINPMLANVRKEQMLECAQSGQSNHSMAETGSCSPQSVFSSFSWTHSQVTYPCLPQSRGWPSDSVTLNENGCHHFQAHVMGTTSRQGPPGALPSHLTRGSQPWRRSLKPPLEGGRWSFNLGPSSPRGLWTC